MSWVRGRDSHIITVRGIGRIFSYNISCHLFHLWRCCLWLQVDEETFISDDRFVSLKKAKESLWTLKVGWKTDWRIKWRNQINIPDKVRQIFQIFKYPNIPDKVRVGTGRRPIRMSGETMHCLYSSQHLQLFYPPPAKKKHLQLTHILFLLMCSTKSYLNRSVQNSKCYTTRVHCFVFKLMWWNWKVSTVPKVSRWIDLVVVVPKVSMLLLLCEFLSFFLSFFLYLYFIVFLCQRHPGSNIFGWFRFCLFT